MKRVLLLPKLHSEKERKQRLKLCFQVFDTGYEKYREGTLLNASYSYYTEEYAQRMCSLYLTDELSRDANFGVLRIDTKGYRS